MNVKNEKKQNKKKTNRRENLSHLMTLTVAGAIKLLTTFYSH